jgi:putative ABC transport system ATP-binding protein
VTKPSLLLADEPTGNLDTAATREMLGLFARVNAEGRTIALITHEPEVAAATQRIVRLSDGLIVSDEHQSAHQFNTYAKAT